MIEKSIRKERKIAKERLSKLQRWILLQCYNEGEYNYKKFNEKYGYRLIGGMGKDYFISRRLLFKRLLNKYYEDNRGRYSEYFEAVEKLISKKIDDEGRKDWFRWRIQVLLTNSIRNLNKKGCIETIHSSVGRKLYQYTHIKSLWLSTKGLSLIMPNINNKRKEGKNES